MIGDPEAPVLHRNDVAPEADSVDEAPAQMVAGLAVALTTGNGITVICTVAVPVHPPDPAPVTVYIVVNAGETTSGLELLLPGFQV